MKLLVEEMLRPVAETRQCGAARILDTISRRSAPASRERKRVIYGHPTGPNTLYHLDDFSGPALRHGRLSSLLHVTSFLPSYAAREVSVEDAPCPGCAIEREK